MAQRIIQLILLLYATLFAPLAWARPMQFAHVQAELISERDGVTSGVDADLALRLIPENGWHVYWKNAGDSGAAPQLFWQVDEQSVDVNIKWPTPEVIEVGHLVNYGYSEEVLLLADVPIPSSASGNVSIGLDAEWLVCKEECIPGNAFFQKDLSVSPPSTLPDHTSHANLFRKFKKTLPIHSKQNDFQVSQLSGGKLQITGIPYRSESEKFRFIPATGGVIQNAAPQKISYTDGKASLTLLPAKNRDLNVKKLEGLILSTNAEVRSSEAISIALPRAPPVSPQSSTTEMPSFLGILLCGFIGGLILNLMPCVFPVLSIKILSFVKKAGECPIQVRNHGFAFASGILVSFWSLGLIIRSLRQAGEQMGWGFQLQNPSFVALLILLLIAVALNFFGVFHIGSTIQRACGAIEKKGSGYSTSFLSGVLATVLATPCTAPFMGGALAYGLSTSLFKCLLVFTTLGIGLAAPYLLLTCFPKLMSQLPKPGAWMETFKQFMGFPVLLTALWLLTVFEQQSLQGERMALLFSILLLSFSLWVYGKICPLCASGKRKTVGLTVLILSLASCVWIGVPGARTNKDAQAVEVAGSSIIKDAYGLEWHKYSPEIVQTFLNQGRPVYVDFTAAWCVTCQLNKKMVFSSSVMRKKFSDQNIVLVRGDWTNEDPVITEALTKFGKAGVPLNILYDPDDIDNPTVFPSLLTPQIVTEELDKL